VEGVVRDELAGQLLDKLMDWEPQEQADWMAGLRLLASYKYDDYEGFSPGERFFESLARWLGQFEPADRRRLMKFVLCDLLFISSSELNHAIACVYPDFIKQTLIAAVADQLRIARHRVREVVTSRGFRTLRGKTLYLGLSDGARLDRLRRASPELSHEQFWLSPELGKHAIETMAEKLGEAIAEQDLGGNAQFSRVVLVDDFYGSGTSLLHRKDDGTWGGKLKRASEHLNEDLRTGVCPLLADEVEVTVVIYVASAAAETHIRQVLSAFEPSWTLQVIQQLPSALSITDPDMVRICEWFFDDVLLDKHKPVRAPLGYKNVALPLILHHNTPNNSIAPLWADSKGRASNERHALFARYERHHVDRP
jgi:hypothetical protein